MNDMTTTKLMPELIPGIRMTSLGIEGETNDLTEDQREQILTGVAEFKAGVDSGMQWICGDAWNLWEAGKAGPGGDENSKRAKCEWLGLPYDYTMQCGTVARTFNRRVRTRQLKFNHYLALAFGKLTKEQRLDLLAQAEENGWSVARLKKEKDAVLGIKKEEPMVIPFLGTKVDRAIEETLAELPKSATVKVKRQVKSLFGDFRTSFEKEVEDEVNRRVAERVERLMRREKEVEERWQNTIRIGAGIKAAMTRNEYKLILGCLHPDRSGTDLKDRLTRAFEIFRNLEPKLKWDD